MGAFLSKRSSSKLRVKTNSEDVQIFKLKLQHDRITQYLKKLQHDIDVDRELARKHVKNNQKTLALYSLRRVKCREKFIEQGLEQHIVLTTLISQIEHQALQVDVVEALKAGTNVLNRINQIIPLDTIDKISDNTIEAIEYQNAIDEKLRKMEFVSDEALENELDMLTTHEHHKDTQVIKEEPELPEFPKVPVAELSIKTTEDSEARETVAILQ